MTKTNIVPRSYNCKRRIRDERRRSSQSQLERTRRRLEAIQIRMSSSLPAAERGVGGRFLGRPAADVVDLPPGTIDDIVTAAFASVAATVAKFARLAKAAAALQAAGKVPP
ncbi:uncharacterized protein B0T15DRAFT_488452 [Chaetomium strumarium]|uniref:Uncharacterized protein n=1 Tax=Chaetomium strumarium TaxID=1170767 RepID=A0AAJ0H0Y8_9PEZI|nr:hypothetical protein B0T15DRAFT_488452 [Chaetomium strumarium]